MIEGLDSFLISKLTSEQVEQVNCSECCNYYIVPKTAACGHSLCHGCWKGRRTCHICAAPVNKKALKLNIPLQTLTEHVHALVEAFEKLFNVKLNEHTLGIPDDKQTTDPTKHVNDWLSSSENHFSAPVSSQVSDNESKCPMELSKSKIQIHSHSKKLDSPQKVVHSAQPQEDWDKIEVWPDTEKSNANQKVYSERSLDFETCIQENKYTIDNPRRSSRKSKHDTNPPSREVSVEKNSGKHSSLNNDNKSLKSKQTWSNVKKMKKEFSKLNKKNKSKLNVSIEMCKKAQNNANKAKPLVETVESDIPIDDNTPDVTNKNSKPQKDTNHPIQDKMDVDETNIEKNVTIKDNNQLLEISNKNIFKLQNEKYIDDDIQKENKIKENNNEDESRKSSRSTKVCNKSSILGSHVKKTSLLPFIKKSALCKKTDNPNIDQNRVEITQEKSNMDTENTDDIEISIKIGNTITNIVIKNKKTNIQTKVNTDREIQTSLGPHVLNEKHDASCSPIPNIQVQNIELNVGEGNKVVVSKSLSIKNNNKETASADTAIALCEILDSADNVGPWNDVNECLESKSDKQPTQKPSPPNVEVKPNELKEATVAVEENVNPSSEDIDDLDIFNSGSVKETTVKMLKDCKHAGSEILQTLKSKKTQRENDEVELPNSKKQKVYAMMYKDSDEDTHVRPELLAKNVANNSEVMNYDVIMTQVFANIDADMQNNKSVESHNLKQKSNKPTSPIIDPEPLASQIIHKTQVRSKNKSLSGAHKQNTSQVNENANQKYSENMFSLLEKDSEPLERSERNNKKLPVATNTQQQIAELLSPGICLSEGDIEAQKDIEMMEPQLGTPMVEHDDDSDKSVVEETPQKNISFAKPKSTEVNKATTSTKSFQQNLQTQAAKKQEIDKASDSQIIRSIINISDSMEDDSKTKDTTVVDMAKRKQTLETPLTINKFVNHITHNSTPIARKSLNFVNDNLDDPEQTLCPSSTQEKEIMAKAFGKTPQSQIRRPLQLRNVSSSSSKQIKMFYIAGSCLTANETMQLKLLCRQRGWTYLDKYTDELTHLVVGVDEENRSQRSVKYMCALAASKWIVAFKWAVKCLDSEKGVVDEFPYEVLDACGEPGPKRSRTALTKVFEGITFFCMPPFSVLGIDTLKCAVAKAGGRVVGHSDGVKVTEANDFKPALLIAEPEHTQEDRFVFLAMEHRVVPVNYEWILNCLGSYSLCSIQELLLCPAALLPPETQRWPEAMMRIADDYY